MPPDPVLPRVPRIEALLGCELADVDEAALQRLCDGSVREDTDLEFKSTLYGTGDSEKRDLCGDIAAFANIVDGVLVLGIADDDGAASALMPVAISDDEVRRMRQVVLAGVAPAPVFAIHPVRTAADPSVGYYLLVVPRSPDAPHAVRHNNGLRYPRRHGSVIRWLAESEVADVYRERFRAETGRIDRLQQIHVDGCDRLDRTKDAWVAAALVPVSPGHFDIRNRSVRTVRHEWTGRWSGGFAHRLVDGGFTVFTGFRRVIVSGSPSPAGLSTFGHAELHADGSAFAARVVWGGQPRRFEGDPPAGIDAEILLDATLTVVGAAVEHAVAASSPGDALLHVALVGPFEAGIALVHARGHGTEQLPGTLVIRKPPVSRRSVYAADATRSAPDLLITVRSVLNDMFQAFGYPEVPHLTEDGEIRLPHISMNNRQTVTTWASKAGVTIVNETVDDN